MRRGALLWIAVALLTPAVTASGDWLILNDGSRVETKDAWTVDGRLVVFDMKDGTKASLRLSEIDLEASEAATREAEQKLREAAKPTPAEAPRQHSVRRITNADIPPGASAAAASTAVEPAGAEDGGEGGTGEAEGVNVTSWEALDDSPDGHLVIRGRVVNRSQATALGTHVVAHVYDHGGELAASGRSQEPLSLAPGAAGKLHDRPARGLRVPGCEVRGRSPSDGVRGTGPRDGRGGGRIERRRGRPLAWTIGEWPARARQVRAVPGPPGSPSPRISHRDSAARLRGRAP